MKTIIGQSTSASTSDVDILTVAITPPTAARVHGLVSASSVDDASTQAQIETATVVSGDAVVTTGNATVTVTSAGMTGSGSPINVALVQGTAQVSTMTVVGTVDADGAGDITVTVAGLLIDSGVGTFDVTVAVANDDTASDVGGKIRAALTDSEITDAYTISGATTDVIITADDVAANDSTLNISYVNDTAAGLTPVTANTATAVGVAQDLEDDIATKIRAVLVANANIGGETGKFTISGTGTAIILTANVIAANDALNIDIDAASTGITTAATSVATQAGSLGTGAHAVLVKGVDGDYKEVQETVWLNGIVAVNTTLSYRFINEMTIISGLVNAGAISATAANDDTVTCTISATEGKSQQAYYMIPDNGQAAKVYFKNLYADTMSGTGDAYTTLKIWTKEAGGTMILTRTFKLDDNKTFLDYDFVDFHLPPRSLVKMTGAASAGSSNIGVAMGIE